MTVAAREDVDRWIAEVERDPGSPAFVSLADAYRKAGRLEEALAVCSAGVERAPRNLRGRSLLALLHLQAGDREGACREWSAALEVDGGHFEANRGLGFHHLERGALREARWHLDRAAAARPADPMVREALALVTRREAEAEARRVRDPARLFEPLAGDAPFRGALLMDERGLLLAGSFADGAAGSAEALGAGLGGVVEEARRAAELLGLGPWRGFVLHAQEVILHMGSLDSGHLVAVATTRDTPTGWVLRTAERAAELARGFLETEHA